MLPFVLQVNENINLVSQKETTAMLTTSILFDRVLAGQPGAIFWAGLPSQPDSGLHPIKHSLFHEASQPTTISSSQLCSLTSPGPCRSLHMHLQGIRILRVRVDDESRQRGRALAGLASGSGGPL